MPFKTSLAAKREAWFVLGSLLILSAAPLALFLPVFLSDKLIYGFDVYTCHLPYRAEIQRSLDAHHWPLWLPGLLGGMPGIASCNLYFLYPSDLIATLAGWPVRIQFALDAFIHVILAGAGMFLFLRRLGRGGAAALLGAFFFSLSGTLVTQLFGGYYSFLEAIALLPWAFWAAHKGRQEGSLFAWGLCGLALGLQVLAQATQIFAYTLPALAAFLFSLDWNRPAPGAGPPTLKARLGAFGPSLAGLALAAGLAFLLCAPQVWMTLQYLPLCARHGYSHAEFNAGSVAVSEALIWLVPGFYGWSVPTYHGSLATTCISEYLGLLPWALAAGAVWALWRREAAVRFMVVLALAAFFFAQRDWTPFYVLFRHLPVFSSFRLWSRILFLVTFAVCTLAAYGWDAFQSAAPKDALRGAAWFTALAAVVAALAWLQAGPSAAHAHIQGWRAVSADGADHTAEILAGLSRGSAQTALALLAGIGTLLWLGARPWGRALALFMALGLHLVDQQAILTRYVRLVAPPAAGEPAMPALPPPPGPSDEPWRVYDGGILDTNRPVTHGYENLGGMQSVPLLSSQKIQAAMALRRRDWLDLMNVRYAPDPLSGTMETSAFQAEPGAFPRAWLVGKSRRVSGDEEAYRLLADPGFHPRQEAALTVDAGLSGAAPRGGVHWLDRDPEGATLDVATDRDAVLVLSNAWYPSWRVAVDGQDSALLKADGGLQAVALKAGRHRVEFSFDPGLFYDALAACFAGLAALVGLAFL